MSCCSSSPSQEAAAKVEPCIVCGRRGRVVERKTVEHLLRDPNLFSGQKLAHYFCANPACEAVYFAPSNRSVFYKGQLKTRVGIKETEDPIPVCYCFGHSRGSVWREIEETGKSTVVESIKAAVQEGRCECDIRNPSGKCCLGEVTQTVQQGFKRLRAPEPVGN